MNLPNFINFEPFNRLRNKMGTIKLGKFEAKMSPSRTPIRRYGPGAIAPAPLSGTESDATDSGKPAPSVTRGAAAGTTVTKKAATQTQAKKTPAKKSSRKKTAARKRPASKAKKKS